MDLLDLLDDTDGGGIIDLIGGTDGGGTDNGGGTDDGGTDGGGTDGGGTDGGGTDGGGTDGGGTDDGGSDGGGTDDGGTDGGGTDGGGTDGGGTDGGGTDGGGTDGGGSDGGGGTDDGGTEIVDPCNDINLASGIATIDDEDYHIIIDQAGLHAIADGLEARYILCDDISLDAAFIQLSPDLNPGIDAFEGVGFSGILEGNYKTISELGIQADGSNNIGLFGKISEGAEIRNLHVSLVSGDETSPSILGKNYVGALAGRNYGMIKSVFVSGGYVKASNKASGLLGYNVGSVDNSYADIDVSGKNRVGGLIGDNDGGTITESHATGNVTGDSKVGGLIGNNSSGEITESYATGSVTGSSKYTGGLIGFNSAGGISKSYATGSVTGNISIGGLVGNNDGGTITGSYTTGSVEGVYRVGGLAGDSNRPGEITDSYATGDVTGTGEGFYFGGLVANNIGNITRSYATGNVTGTGAYFSGFVVNNFGSITNSYFDATTTGHSQITGGQQGIAFYTYIDDSKVYTAADGGGIIVIQDSFEGWDFDTMWTWQEDGQWPTLRSQYE